MGPLQLVSLPSFSHLQWALLLVKVTLPSFVFDILYYRNQKRLELQILDLFKNNASCGINYQFF